MSVARKALCAVLALVPVLALTGAAHAVTLARPGDESVEVCYNYDCRARATVRFDDQALDPVRRVLAEAADAAAEREAIAYAMGWMYFLAGQQTPIWRDRGGNFDDGDYLNGRMDCIDHSTNTTAFLRVLERRGWLRHHRVLDPVRRGRFLDIHWAGHVAEVPSAGVPSGEASENAASLQATGSADGREYVVDTWFHDPGHPAMVAPLRDWMRGARPPGK